MTPKRLLIVAHAPSANTLAMRDAVQRGATGPDIENVAVQAIAPLAARPDDVLAANAIILGTPENLGYMSGALKDFFDRIYYPCLSARKACPTRFTSARGTTAPAPGGRCRPSSPVCAGAPRGSH